MSQCNFRKTLLVGLAALFAACSPAEQEGGSNVEVVAEVESLEGSRWQLAQLTVLGGHVFEPDDPSKYDLYFRSGDRLTGSSDCNDIQGSWFQEADTLRFEPFRVTRALCAPGSLHNNLTLYMMNVSGYKLEGERLVLTTPTEEVAIEYKAVQQP